MNNIELNFIELNKEYPYSHMELVNDKYMIEGRVRIYATNDDVQLMDDFTIVMEVPLGFPKELPVIKETSNKIPKTFEHVNIDRSLCLGIETEIKIKFTFIKFNIFKELKENKILYFLGNPTILKEITIKIFSHSYLGSKILSVISNKISVYIRNYSI